MSALQSGSNWAIHSILHQNSQKHKQLGASFLLTSSFAHQKQQIHQRKREKLESLAANNVFYHQEVLQARRINGNEEASKGLDQPFDVSLSNLDRLKSHARRLMDEDIRKLGKENRWKDEEQQNKINGALSEHLIADSNFRVTKRPNKRKIVKGRPEMYAITKKRVMLLKLGEEDIKQMKQGKDGQRHFLRDLLDKNSLLRFISTKNDKAEQGNLYENFEKHKTVQQIGKIRQRKGDPKRASLSIIRPLGNKYTRLSDSGGVQQSQNFNVSGILPKRRRYSSIRTIQ